MDRMTKLGSALGQLLKDRNESIAIAESSTGGLISAALLAVPGASSYFLGGGVIYTRAARRGLLVFSELDAGLCLSSCFGYSLSPRRYMGNRRKRRHGSHGQ